MIADVAAEVIANTRLTRDYNIVSLAAADVARAARPGQFVMERRRYTPARLKSLLADNGLQVLRMTFTNMTTFPLTLASRLLERVRGRASDASDADLRVPPAPINALLSGAVAIDGTLLRAVDLPIGSSLLAIARKK